MALYLNGKKVAGIGAPGLSPFQVAQANGYAGTEAEFTEQLVNIPNKQDNLTGAENQIVGFNSEGKAVNAQGKVIGCVLHVGVTYSIQAMEGVTPLDSMALLKQKLGIK